ERATRYGLTRESIDDFQRSRSPRVAWLKGMRSLTMSGARRYVSPSCSLKETASRWPLVRGERIVVLPNPVEAPPAADREELLAAGDASLLSSSWENFPHAVVEGLAAGTPVIATDVGGVPEIVTDGVNGLLVPMQDVPALAAAIRRFFADAELRARLTAAAH